MANSDNREAAAMEIAHPCPENAISATTPPSNRISMVIESPQIEFFTSDEQVGYERVPKCDGWW